MTEVILPPEVAQIPASLDRMALALERLAAGQRPAVGLAGIAAARADLAAAWDHHVARRADTAIYAGDGKRVDLGQPCFTADQVRDFLLDHAPTPARVVELDGHAYDDLGFPDAIAVSRNRPDGADVFGFDYGPAGRFAVLLDFAHLAHLTHVFGRR